MYRVVTNVTIVQVPRSTFPTRNKTLFFDFVVDISSSDNWRDFTNEAKITLPKNLYVRNEFDKLVPISGTNNPIGGFNGVPLVMRGDKITIDFGYRYFDKDKEVLQWTNDGKGGHLFDGYISEVTSKKPIEIKAEDNFWLLKQQPAPIKTYPKTMSLESIVADLIKPIPKLSVDRTTSTLGLGEFRVGNETVAEVLGRLRKSYHFESYFRGNILYCGSQIYQALGQVPTHNFEFQKNIIEDNLQYKRKDDLVLSILASNTVEENNGQCKDGSTKTKKKRIEVLVTFRGGSDTPTYLEITKEHPAPPNDGGERMTMPYPFAKNISDLKKLATDEIIKYYYTGFKGKFTTFGLPFVKMGDNVQLKDPILPERDGKYKVKGVEYTAGVGGIRQIIQLEYKIQ